MNQHASNADGLGRMDHAPRRILEESSTQSTALVITRDGQARQHDNRNRIGHVASEPSGRCGRGYRAGRERVVSDNQIRIAGDERARRAACLVLDRPTFQLIIERRDTGVEGGNAVVNGQRLRRSEHQPFAHGAAVRIVLRRRSLG